MRLRGFGIVSTVLRQRRQMLETEYRTTVNNRFIHSLIGSVAVLLCASGMSSCNEDSDSRSFSVPANLAVKEFSLSADKDNPGLDSVYFSIDLEHGVIFNADSLRKGTRIDKVVPKITFGGVVSEATIEMKGGETREGEVDFKKNPTDSIDFTGDVTLRLKADDGKISMDYRIKVNVHRENPDTMLWSKAPLAGVSMKPNPLEMKTVERNGYVISLIKESDGSYSYFMPQTADLSVHESGNLIMPFIPRVRTLCITDDATWILADDGRLWKGRHDLQKWEPTDVRMDNIIGSYTNTVVGIGSGETGKTCVVYPQGDLGEETLPADFPLEGFSNLVTLENKWTLSPVAFFTGGRMADGTCSASTWAFDGRKWVKLSEGGIPAMTGATVIPYYNYRVAADGHSMNEYPVWMLTGGRLADGSFNKTIYISYDNGVNWSRGGASLQFPDDFAAVYDCDNVVVGITHRANLNEGWQVPSGLNRLKYSVEGEDVIWECPVIYLFGGFGTDVKLSADVWQGVLNRLRFVPII